MDTIAALRGFGGEVLVLAGAADERAPVALSVRMDREFRRMGLRTRLVRFAGVGHGGISRAQEYATVLTGFIERVQRAE